MLNWVQNTLMEGNERINENFFGENKDCIFQEVCL